MAALIRDAGDGPWIHGRAGDGRIRVTKRICSVRRSPSVAFLPCRAALSFDEAQQAGLRFWICGAAARKKCSRDALVANLCCACLDRLQLN
jgi:hypothetical protein